jgi:RNA polymerase sigma-70 factor, ECF subfamily
MLRLVDEGAEASAIAALQAEIDGPAQSVFAAHLATLAEAPHVLADYYLAYAALAGAPLAVRRVRETAAREVEAVARRARRQAADASDLLQSIVTRLLVSGPGGGPPGLASYGGAGPLAVWLRVVAARELVSRGRKRADVVDDDAARGHVMPASGSGADPEADYLRTKYRAVFHRAFKDAAAELSPEDRNILRYHYVDSFSIDRLSAMYGLHRASVARRIHRAREALLGATRERLRREAFASDTELESVLRVVESQVELSVTSLFGAPPDPGSIEK